MTPVRALRNGLQLLLTARSSAQAELHTAPSTRRAAGRRSAPHRASPRRQARPSAGGAGRKWPGKAGSAAARGWRSGRCPVSGVGGRGPAVGSRWGVGARLPGWGRLSRSGLGARRAVPGCPAGPGVARRCVGERRRLLGAGSGRGVTVRPSGRLDRGGGLRQPVLLRDGAAGVLGEVAEYETLKCQRWGGPARAGGGGHGLCRELGRVLRMGSLAVRRWKGWGFCP